MFEKVMEFSKYYLWYIALQDMQPKLWFKLCNPHEGRSKIKGCGKHAGINVKLCTPHIKEFFLQRMNK